MTDVASSFDLILDGEEHRIPIAEGETLLQAALTAGIEAPFSCAEGHCGMCMARLHRGAVSMDCTTALTRDDIEFGLVLACQSRLVSSTRILLNFDF